MRLMKEEERSKVKEREGKRRGGKYSMLKNSQK